MSSTSSSTFQFEIEFRVSSSSFCVPASRFEFRVPFWDLFSVPFRVHLGTHFRSLSGSQKGPEKDHFEQQSTSEHSVGRTHEKEKFSAIRFQGRISLTLPLSSFGWLRNNSSSRRKRPMRASVIKFKVRIKPEMSATEAQLGLDSEHEFRFGFEL